MTDPIANGWRQPPFAVGHSYRVRRDFKAPHDSFQSGEVLTFVRGAYSAYHGYTGYFFSQPGSVNLRSWDIHDDDDLEVWKSLFEEIQSDGRQ